MTTALSAVIAVHIEKATVDNGFDQELPPKGDWLGFASTWCPLRIWLGTFGKAVAGGHRLYLPWHRERLFENGAGHG